MSDDVVREFPADEDEVGGAVTSRSGMGSRDEEAQLRSLVLTLATHSEQLDEGVAAELLKLLIGPLKGAALYRAALEKCAPEFLNMYDAPSWMAEAVCQARRVRHGE